MNKKSGTSNDAADRLVKNIRRKSRQTYSAEEKIRIVLAGLRGEESISVLCRPSIAPERLIRASLLQMLFSIRSERPLMEQMDYNLMFRWFVGLGSTIPCGVKGARKSVRWTDFSPERAKPRAEGRPCSPRTATGC